MVKICAGVTSTYMEFTLANWNLKIHLSFQMSVDDMLCGNRRYVPSNGYQSQFERLHAYHKEINKHKAA